MTQHLLALEQGPATEAGERVIADLFREAHSLKGAARAVNLVRIEALSHGLENLFARMREGGAEPATDVLQHAYQTIDSIAAMVGDGPGTQATEAPPQDPPPSPGRDEPADLLASGRRASEATVRVATGKVDALMAGVGELLVGRICAERRVADVRALEATLDEWDSAWRALGRRGHGQGDAEAAGDLRELGDRRLQAARRDLTALRRLLDADAHRSARITADLQDGVRRIRMLPVSTVLEPLRRMVRDLARDRGKEVILHVSGVDVEVDRSVLELIRDPLTHLLRNSVDHGIEPPAIRAGAGKPATGTIALSVQHRGDRLVIEVADDGTGIDVEAVRTCAVKQGLVTPAADAELTDRQAMSLIFRSGLTTRPIITDLSGRGVGLDVVREVAERLHGSVDVESRRGAGTAVTLCLPLSISSMQCLLVGVEGQTFALPVTSVERVMRLGPDDIRRAAGRETVGLEGRPVVLARLAEVLALSTVRDAREQPARQPVVVLGNGERCAAFLVDVLTQTCEVVVKSLPDPLVPLRHLAGATILGSGEVAVILSPADLVASVEQAQGQARTVVAATDVPPPVILVVEDSLTTRTLERNLLEAAGYRVRVAADGAEGWGSLQSDGCDLVVADVEMPVLDGFELTARIRADQRYRDLPVVLVTSRDTRADRERGIQVGADAYIVKGALDQGRLLDTIRRLI